MTEQAVRVAVVGCGAWGANHVRVFQSLRDTVVCAAVDPDPARLEWIGQLHPTVRLERQVESVLADPEIDAVVVATPTGTHYEMVRRALDAGKHVLAEKPLTETSVEGEELAHLAAASRVVLAVGHVFLFNAGVAKLRELLAAGEIGEPRFLQAVRTNLGPIRTDVNAAYDLATHDISIFNWLLGGEPEMVSASGAAFLQPDVHDVVSISLRYGGGVFATIQASWLNPKKVRQITVVGTQAMMVWDDLELSNPVAIYDKRAEATRAISDYGHFLRVSMSDGDVRLPKVELEEPLHVQARAFLAEIRGDGDGRADAAEGVKVVRTLEAVQRSLEQGGVPVNVVAAVDR
jgi:predicted dehydrogenase